MSPSSNDYDSSCPRIQSFDGFRGSVPCSQKLGAVRYLVHTLISTSVRQIVTFSSQEAVSTEAKICSSKLFTMSESEAAAQTSAVYVNYMLISRSRFMMRRTASTVTWQRASCRQNNAN